MPAKPYTILPLGVFRRNKLYNLYYYYHVICNLQQSELLTIERYCFRKFNKSLSECSASSDADVVFDWATKNQVNLVNNKECVEGPASIYEALASWMKTNDFMTFAEFDALKLTVYPSALSYMIKLYDEHKFWDNVTIFTSKGTDRKFCPRSWFLKTQTWYGKPAFLHMWKFAMDMRMDDLERQNRLWYLQFNKGKPFTVKPVYNLFKFLGV